MFDKVVISCPDCFQEEERVVSGVAGTGGVYRLEEIYPEDEVLYESLPGFEHKCPSCGFVGEITLNIEAEKLELIAKEA